MNRCLITYQPCGNQHYSQKGLTLLAKKLQTLEPFPLSASQQLALAGEMATKLSIQGIQPKLSIKLNVSKQRFDVVEKGGEFILKPPHQLYGELPQNEDLTMRLARMVGIDVPLHGLIYNVDASLSYFVKRFDRLPRGHKVALEDFSQLLGFDRDTKYDSSMEKVAAVLEKFCTFPMLEKIKLYRVVLFNFLVGNEDMHLKNFSLINYKGKVSLSPAYDLLNSTIVLKGEEEIALPIRGKKSKLTRYDLIDYFGKERLGLDDQVIEQMLAQFAEVMPQWKHMISISFLSRSMQEEYVKIVDKRCGIING